MINRSQWSTANMPDCSVSHLIFKTHEPQSIVPVRAPARSSVRLPTVSHAPSQTNSPTNRLLDIDLQLLVVFPQMAFFTALIPGCITSYSKNYLCIQLKHILYQVGLVYGLHRLEVWSCRVLTSTSQQSFSFHGPTVWNSLPSALLSH